MSNSQTSFKARFINPRQKRTYDDERRFRQEDRQAAEVHRLALRHEARRRPEAGAIDATAAEDAQGEEEGLGRDRAIALRRWFCSDCLWRSGRWRVGAHAIDCLDGLCSKRRSGLNRVRGRWHRRIYAVGDSTLSEQNKTLVADWLMTALLCAYLPYALCMHSFRDSLGRGLHEGALTSLCAAD